LNATTSLALAQNSSKGCLSYTYLTERDAYMKKRLLLAVGVILTTGLLIASLAGDTPKKEPAVDYDKLAASIGNQGANIHEGETEGLLADIAPERFRVRADANKTVAELIRKRGLRSINLGNGLYPTATLAKEFGVSQDDLSRIFWNGVNVNYTDLQTTADKVK